MLWGSAVTAPAASAATLSLNPDRGTAAMVITASGSGFCAAFSCGGVRITFNGITAASKVRVLADGTFTVSFQPLSGRPGDATVEASQTAADGSELSATASFALDLTPIGVAPPPGVNAADSALPPEAAAQGHAVTGSSAKTGPPAGLGTGSAAGPGAHPVIGASSQATVPQAARPADATTVSLQGLTQRVGAAVPGRGGVLPWIVAFALALAGVAGLLGIRRRRAAEAVRLR
jgi:hypothetical protein